MHLLSVGSQEFVCPSGAVLILQTVHTGKKLCDGVDHDQIDPSSKVTEGFSLDNDHGVIGYTTDYVSDLLLIVPPSMGLFMYGMNVVLSVCTPSIPPAAHSIMEVHASLAAQVDAHSVVVPHLQVPVACYRRI